MSLGEFFIEKALMPMGAYLVLVFLFRLGILYYFERRYSGEAGMRTFLLPYHRAHRALFLNKEFDTAKGIGKIHAHAWGMAGAGTTSMAYGWHAFQNGQPIWLPVTVSILWLLLHAHAMAKAAFSAKCFHALGITSLTDYFRPFENDRQLAS